MIGSEICAGALIITKGDTQADRGLWRLRPERVEMLPPLYRPLAKGAHRAELLRWRGNPVDLPQLCVNHWLPLGSRFGREGAEPVGDPHP